MPLCSLADRTRGCSPKCPQKGPRAPGTPFIPREREAAPEEQDNHGRGEELPDPWEPLPAQDIPQFCNTQRGNGWKASSLPIPAAGYELCSCSPSMLYFLARMQQLQWFPAASKNPPSDSETLPSKAPRLWGFLLHFLVISSKKMISKNMNFKPSQAFFFFSFFPIFQGPCRLHPPANKGQV